MSKPTRSKIDRELEKTQALLSMRRLAPYLQAERQVMKDTRLAKKLFEKTQKPRIRKPKVKRRLKNRTASRSRRGKNTEDENDYKSVN